MSDINTWHNCNELLISEIKKREALWNKRSLQYKNRVHVEAAWEEVSQQIKTPKEEVKAKWKNLRDTFFKELKKISIRQSGNGGVEPTFDYKGRWQHFSQLLFLKDMQITRTMEGDISERLDTEEHSCLSQPVEMVDSSKLEIDTEGDIYECVEVNPIPLPPPTVTVADDPLQTPTSSRCYEPLSKKYKLKMSPFEEKLIQMEAEKMKVVEKNARKEDEDTHFFDSLLPYYKQLGDIQKLRVRNEFQSVLIKALSRENDN